ncbi:hypothetical protein [Methylobacter sp.]|uniref:hypothetical protein n=1 Tax=Methylobacter sp. TaxID=2051955 RepID=UPI002FDE3DFF
MSAVGIIKETIVQFMPGNDADSLMHKPGYVGKAINRVDTKLKVKGEAAFTADFKLDNPVYAALVYSTITKGKITRIDRSVAENSIGVLAVITYENAPKIHTLSMFEPSSESKGAAASDCPILQNEYIHRDSQPIAVVIVETLDQAEHAD